MTKSKCPECGIRHKHQMSAQSCLSEANWPLTHAIIANVAGGKEIDHEILVRADIMEEYYNSLPYPPKIYEKLNILPKGFDRGQ
jgi:hypothetical protein